MSKRPKGKTSGTKKQHLSRNMAKHSEPVRKRRLAAVAAVILLFAGLNIVMWLLLATRRDKDPVASTSDLDEVTSLTFVVSNAGLALRPEDATVRLFAAGRPNQVIAEGRANEAVSLPAGSYDALILLTASADGQSQRSKNIRVLHGKRTVVRIEFSSGQLAVHATVGAAPAGADKVVAYVYEEGNHDKVVATATSDQSILIRPGTYDVRTVLLEGSQEKDVRWRHKTPVKTGLQTKLTPKFERASVLVRATSAGQPLDEKDVKITIYRAGDTQREIVETGVAGRPIELTVGQYDVRMTCLAAIDKPSRWLENVELLDGASIEKKIDFACGSITVTAVMADSDALGPFDAYVYYYDLANHEQPLAYTPAGETSLLSSGRYDIRVHYERSHDQPDIWLNSLVLDPGASVTRQVAFESGRVLIRAYDEEGLELIGDNVFLHVFPAGHRQLPLATARSGENLLLSAGTYDVRIRDTRTNGRVRWLENIELRPGKALEYAVKMRGAE